MTDVWSDRAEMDRSSEAHREGPDLDLLVEWAAGAEAAGFVVEDVRFFDKPIELEPWLDRTGCAGEDAQRVRTLLEPRVQGDHVTLDRIAIRAVKA